MVSASAVAGRGAVVNHADLLRGGLPFWVATLMFLGGWQVMLWAMMVPASVDAIRWRRGLRDQAVFTSGYLGIWTGFGLLLLVFDVVVHGIVNHSPWLSLHPWLIAGGVLVFTGAFQLSHLKVPSLAACRVWETGPPSRATSLAASLAAGFGYGVKCVGSSGALMFLAFALGMGSIPFIAGFTALMVWETTPWGAKTVPLVGYTLIGVGVVILAGPFQGLPLWAG